MEVTELLGILGTKFSELSTLLMNKLSELGIDNPPAKLFNLVLFLSLLLLFIKVIEIPKKILKFAVIILLVILTVSTVFSFFS